ncbi:MAG: hypothetical protein EXS63_00560 [Candidatus Omnitrophica bacterium]|nr:hypothetical protein [Candidatus Omnitrophota bacterium]
MKKSLLLTTLLLPLLSTGCVGYDVPPRIFHWKPFRLLRSSEQVGRDQVTNRLFVAVKAYPLRGRFSNEVLSFLGQPQEIKILERGVSEDWLYIYYKPHLKERIDSEEGSFLVRFYNDKVIDVVRDVV